MSLRPTSDDVIREDSPRSSDSEGGEDSHRFIASETDEVGQQLASSFQDPPGTLTDKEPTDGTASTLFTISDESRKDGGQKIVTETGINVLKPKKKSSSSGGTRKEAAVPTRNFEVSSILERDGSKWDDAGLNIGNFGGMGRSDPTPQENAISQQKKRPGDHDVTLPDRLPHQPAADQFGKTKSSSGVIGSHVSPPGRLPASKPSGLKVDRGLGSGQNDGARHNLGENDTEKVGVLDWEELLNVNQDGDDDDSSNLVDEEFEFNSLDASWEGVKGRLELHYQMALSSIQEEHEVMDPSLVGLRMNVVNELEVGGNLATFISLTREQQDQTLLNENVLRGLIWSEIQRREELLSMAKRSTTVTGMPISSFFALVGSVGKKLVERRDDLMQMMSEEEFSRISECHGLLLKMLSGEKTKRGAKMFPTYLVGEVMDWYFRVDCMFDEMDHTRKAYYQASKIGAGLVRRMPYVDIPDKGSRVSSESNRSIVFPARDDPSVGTTLGMESARERGLSKTSGIDNGIEIRHDEFTRENLAKMGRCHRLLDPRLDNPTQVLNSRLATAKPVVTNHNKLSERVLDKTLIGGASEKDDVSVASSSTGNLSKSKVELEQMVEQYATKRLEEVGEMSKEALDILMTTIPNGEVLTRPGNISKMLDYGVKAVEFVKPYMKDSFINIKEWWELLGRHFDDYGLSIRMRMRVMAKTGGLPEKGYELFKRKVKHMMQPREITDWLPEYDTNRDESDKEYWIYTWIDLGAKLISEFHVVQGERVIEEGLDALFKDKEYRIINDGDALNTEFYKVCMIFKAAMQYLRDRGSQMVGSPAIVMQKVQDWLYKKQGPIGVQMEQAIATVFKQVVKNPEKVLPLGHRLTHEDLAEIKRLGGSGITEKVYNLLLKELNRKAVAGELTFEIRTGDQLAQIVNIAKDRKKDKNEKASNHVSVKTDWRPNAGNSGTDRKEGTDNKGKDNPTCQTCNMYCNGENGKCNYWDKSSKTFKVGGFMDQAKNRYIGEDGRQYLGNNAFKRLKLFGFEKMGITKAEDQEKIYQDLRAAARTLPIVPESERWTNSKGTTTRQVNFAEAVSTKETPQPTREQEKIRKLEQKVSKLTTKLEKPSTSTKTSKSSKSAKTTKTSSKTGSKSSKKPKSTNRWEDSEDSSDDSDVSSIVGSEQAEDSDEAEEDL